MDRDADVVIYGKGQMARLANFYLMNDSPFDVVAFTAEEVDEPVLEGLPIIGIDEVERRYPPSTVQMFVAIGFGNVNRDRRERYDQVKRMGYSTISYISSTTIVAPDVAIGENCFIMEGNIIQPFSRIGDDVTLGPGNCIGHHCSIGDHCFFASRADLSGNVTIGSSSFVGANATIRNAVTIGSESVIGAGAVVMKSTEAGEVLVSPRAGVLPLPSSALPRI
jgi:sugar O-acyltransferase (sialic acid O-acetyltransferase NeuD family)